MSNTAFNVGIQSWTHKSSEHNFRSFYKNNKTLLFWMHLSTFIAFLIITATINEPIKILLYRYVWSNFATFQWKGFFEKLFNYSAIAQFSQIKQNENLFINYQVTLFGAAIVLTSDVGFALFDFFDKRKRLNELKLSFGIFVHPDLEKWSKDILKSFVDCMIIAVKAILCWVFLSFSIFTSLLGGNIFEHNFFLAALQFATALWVFIPALMMYNYYSWYTEYYNHFTKLDKYKDNTDQNSQFLIKKICKEAALAFLSFFVILVSLPYDLFLIYLAAKHISFPPHNKKEKHIKTSFVY